MQTSDELTAALDRSFGPAGGAPAAGAGEVDELTAALDRSFGVTPAEPDGPAWGGLGEAFTDPLGLLGQIASGAMQTAGGGMVQAERFSERYLPDSDIIQFAPEIAKMLGETLLEASPEFDPKFGITGEVAHGLGSMGAFVPLGVVGGLPGLIAVGAGSVLAEGFSEFEASMEKDPGNVDKAWTRFWISAPAAAMEGVSFGPVAGRLGKVFARVDRATGGELHRTMSRGVLVSGGKRLLTDMAKEGGQEALQEASSILGEHLTQGEADTLSEALAALRLDPEAAKNALVDERSRIYHSALIGALAVGPFSMVASAVEQQRYKATRQAKLEQGVHLSDTANERLKSMGENPANWMMLKGPAPEATADRPTVTIIELEDGTKIIRRPETPDVPRGTQTEAEQVKPTHTPEEEAARKASIDAEGQGIEDGNMRRNVAGQRESGYDGPIEVVDASEVEGSDADAELLNDKGVRLTYIQGDDLLPRPASYAENEITLDARLSPGQRRTAILAHELSHHLERAALGENADPELVAGLLAVVEKIEAEFPGLLSKADQEYMALLQSHAAEGPAWLNDKARRDEARAFLFEQFPGALNQALQDPDAVQAMLSEAPPGFVKRVLEWIQTKLAGMGFGEHPLLKRLKVAVGEVPTAQEMRMGPEGSARMGQLMVEAFDLLKGLGEGPTEARTPGEVAGALEPGAAPATVPVEQADAQVAGEEVGGPASPPTPATPSTPVVPALGEAAQPAEALTPAEQKRKARLTKTQSKATPSAAAVKRKASAAKATVTRRSKQTSSDVVTFLRSQGGISLYDPITGKPWGELEPFLGAGYQDLPNQPGLSKLIQTKPGKGMSLQGAVEAVEQAGFWGNRDNADETKDLDDLLEAMTSNLEHPDSTAPEDAIAAEGARANQEYQDRIETAAQEAGKTVEELEAEIRTISQAEREDLGDAPDFDHDDWVPFSLGGETRFALIPRGAERFALAPNGKAPPFYSAVERYVDGLKQERFSRPQLAAMLRKAPGVTAEELKWLDAGTLFSGKGPVTKAEVLAWLRENAVEVREKVLDGGNRAELSRLRDPMQDASRAFHDQAESEGVSQLDRANVTLGRSVSTSKRLRAGDFGSDGLRSLAADFWDAQDAYQDAFDRHGGVGDSVRHGTLQEPGGENYRELLLTLPVMEGKELPPGFKVYQDPSGSWGVEFPTGTAVGGWPTREAAVASQARQLGSPTYTSGHYGDMPNVLAHIRFNERTMPDGTRMLFVEEIQSDWHQKGRELRTDEIERLMKAEGITKAEASKRVPVEFGYKPVSDKPPALVAKRSGPTGSGQFYWEVSREEDGAFVTNVTDPSIGTEEMAVEEAVRRMSDSEYGRLAHDTRVPDAPFKTAWPTLALKRAIKFAADNGFDSVGWTTGVMQVERYEDSYRQQVESMSWGRNQDGSKGLNVYQPGGGRIEMDVAEDGTVSSAELPDANGKQLSDVIGKHLAARILSEESGTAEGDDLTIGGEGMKGFYDNMLVSAANKLGKRFGVKVGGGTIRTGNAPDDVLEQYADVKPFQDANRATIHQLPLTDDMRATVREQGFSTFAPKFALALPTEKMGNAKDAAKAFYQHNLTARGNIPKDAFKSLLERDFKVGEALMEVQLASRAFRRGVKQAYGKAQMTPEQNQAVDAVFKGQSPMRTLPGPLHGPVLRLRTGVDALSRRLIDVGAVDADLIPVIERNIGVYATRSYRAFDDPLWPDKIPQEVRNRAINLIRKEILRREKRVPTEDELEGIIMGLLTEGTAAGDITDMMKKAMAGEKNLSILKRRTGIPPEIRALLGEYEDAMVNYTRSVTHMAHLIANHEFLGEVRSMGIEQGWLSTRRSAKNYVTIATEGSKVLDPLNVDPETGERAELYTTPEIQKAFREATETKQLPTWFKTYLGALAAVKIGKTVGSVVTHERNIIGNIGFATAQGHWRVGKMGMAFKTVMTVAGARKIGPWKLDERKWEAYYKEAMRLGLIHESAGAGEILDLVNDVANRSVPEAFDEQINRRNLVGKTVQFLARVYQLEDDLWKLYAWENEKARLRSVYSQEEMIDEQVGRKAAEIVRNTYPTYSLVPRFVKGMRRFPITGSFVSFPAEVVRTAGNTITQIRDELADERLRPIGIQRLIGTIMAATGTGAAAMASRILLGIGADDDEDAREFMPPWSRNHDILWVGNTAGKPWYVDLGFTDPYSYLKSPLRAFMRGDDWESMIVDPVAEFADPWIGEEILTRAIREVASNKKQSGAEVYNEAGSYTEKAQEILEHLWNGALQPGTISTLRRLEKARTGQVANSGKAYSLPIEGLNASTGFRLTELDVEQALSFHARDYKRSLSGATRLLSSTASRRGTVDDGELTDAYQSMEQSRQKSFEDMQGLLSAASRLGLTRSKLRGVLEGAMGEKSARLVQAGRYTPYTPSSQFLAAYGRGAERERKRELDRRRRFLITLAREETRRLRTQ